MFPASAAVAAHLSTFNRHAHNASCRPMRAGSLTWLVREPPPLRQAVPVSGPYSSSALLQAVQSRMVAEPGRAGFSPPSLVAYMSATEAVRGQGWRLRATLFLQLTVPRYTLLAPLLHPSLLEPLAQLQRAANDLPAVGAVLSAEDASVGYPLSCSSPALDYGMGPQPLAVCLVWPPPSQQQHQGSSSSSSSAASNASVTAAGEDVSYDPAASAGPSEPLETWLVLPNSNDSSAAAAVRAWAAAAAAGSKDVPLKLLPLLNGQGAAAGGGGVDHDAPQPGSVLGLLAALDTWVVFPRAQLLRLIPAMSGLQQLLLGHAGAQGVQCGGDALCTSACVVSGCCTTSPVPMPATTTANTTAGRHSTCMPRCLLRAPYPAASHNRRRRLHPSLPLPLYAREQFSPTHGLTYCRQSAHCRRCMRS